MVHSFLLRNTLTEANNTLLETTKRGKHAERKYFLTSNIIFAWLGKTCMEGKKHEISPQSLTKYHYIIKRKKTLKFRVF